MVLHPGDCLDRDLLPLSVYLLFQSLGIAAIVIRIAYYIKQMLFTKKS